LAVSGGLGWEGEGLVGSDVEGAVYCCSPLSIFAFSKQRSGRAAPYQAQPLVGVSVQVRVGWP
jgi:hypothetical protein